MVILAIVGSVNFTHDGDTTAAVKRVRYAIDRLAPDRIVSGGADGMDTIAARIGRELDIDVKEYLPKVRCWAGPGGFKERNIKIAENCTHLLRIYCLSSRTYGSGWTADLAEQLGRQVQRYSPCKAASNRK